MRAKPVTIRGITYPSQRAADQALGISSGCVSRRVARGTLGGRWGHKPQVFALDGIEATAREHAARLGVAVGTIHSRIGRQRASEGWFTIDEAEPLRALRLLAGLSLTEAARLAGLAGPSSVQGNERAEGRDGSSTTIGTLRKRADAWGYDIRIQVRRKGNDDAR